MTRQARSRLHYHPCQTVMAQRLAGRLDLQAAPLHIRSFPDGESLVRVEPHKGAAWIYCSLHHPNDKLVELALAASALRDGGAERLVLIAPYLCYMRQDMAFHAGEAVSQKVIGRMLGGLFDHIVTVDPHLHRTHALSQVFGDTEASCLTATGVIADFLRGRDGYDNAVIVGPDAESRQWVAQVAAPLGLSMLVGDKRRNGDREVEIEIAGVEAVAGRPVIILDDMVSSGMTVVRCAGRLRAAGAASIDLVTVHALCGEADMKRLHDAGIRRMISTDSAPHPTNGITLDGLLADALEKEL